MSKNQVTLALWFLWPVAGTYFALCIGIPEIRPYWRNGSRFGLFSSIGFTIALAGSWLVYALIITGVFSDKLMVSIYPVAGLGVTVAVLGGWIEAAEQSEDRKRKARRFRKKDYL